MDKPARSRRNFLFPKPKPVSGPPNVLAQSRYETHQKHETGEEAYGHLICVAQEAMATKFEILYPELEPRGSVELCRKAHKIIDRVESQLTVYRETSEVSRLNRSAYERPVEVSENLYDLIERSRKIWEETEGAFDITAGPLLKAWGIHQRQQRQPGQDEIEDVMQRVGMQYVRLHRDTHAISFLRPGIELNFGSNGKGYALDCAVDFLRENGLPLVYLQGGGSSHYGAGEPPWDLGWRVEISDPLDLRKVIATLRFTNMGMATSGLQDPTPQKDGSYRRHIIDPRTGRLAEGLLGVTVVCPTAEESDALATAFTILGVERARKYCQTRSNIGMLLVPPPGTERVSDADPDRGELLTLGILESNPEMIV